MENKSIRPQPSTYSRGKTAEERARRLLEGQALAFVEGNFRWRGGEIDLVMGAPDGTIVFVEVRSSTQHSPWLRYSVSPRKQQRLVRTAHTYFQRRPWLRGRAFRFDLVWIEGESLVEHWPNVLVS